MPNGVDRNISAYAKQQLRLSPQVKAMLEKLPPMR